MWRWEKIIISILLCLQSYTEVVAAVILCPKLNFLAFNAEDINLFNSVQLSTKYTSIVCRHSLQLRQEIEFGFEKLKAGRIVGIADSYAVIVLADSATFLLAVNRIAALRSDSAVIIGLIISCRGSDGRASA